MASKYTKALLVAMVTLVAANTFASSADLSLRTNGVRPISRVDPGTPMSYGFRAANSGPDAAAVRFTMPLPAGVRFVSVSDSSWQCSAGNAAVICTRSMPPSADEVVFDIDIVAPEDLRGLSTTLLARVESDLPDPHPETNAALQLLTVYRTFIVDTADDFGAASLRATIERANAGCDGAVPCKIRFERAMRIAPRSPLSAISGCDITVDGGVYDPFNRTRNRYFDAPRMVEIAGHEVASGSGLLVASQCRVPYLSLVTLRGLAIGGFPENGIELRNDKGAPLSVEGCFIGTDATGTVAVPNGLRGISADAPRATLQVSDSLIAGNARSGVAVWNAGNAQFSGNLIGVRFGGIPMPNGASGVYIAAASLVRFDRNAIEYNREFGIAIGPGARHVVSNADYIVANGGLAIDWGLDGPTADRAGVPPVPRLTDAHFDPAKGATVVRGVLHFAGQPEEGFYTVRALLSAGDYDGGLQFAQQETSMTGLPRGDLPFEIVVKGDWTGQRIAAQSVYFPSAFEPAIDSSEFSAGIVVR